MEVKKIFTHTKKKKKKNVNKNKKYMLNKP